MWKRRRPNDLTPRECEVLKLLRLGLTNEEISQRLGITVAGAKYHVSQILSKLGVTTREEAVAWRSEEHSWYWKLAWLGGASIVVAAAAGLAALLSDSGTNLILESDNVAGDSVTGATIPTPMTHTTPPATADTPGLRSSAPTPPPTSEAAAIGPTAVTSERGSMPTRTPAASATRSAMPTPTPTHAGGGVPGGSGNIAFWSDTNGGDIQVMAHDGSGRASITSGPETDGSPAWSPDGTRITFSRISMGYSHDIFVANADGSGVTNLTNKPGTYYNPAWSPDGSRIALSKDYGLWVMNADGSAATMIVGGPDFYVYWPSWSPDSSKIAFYGIHASQGAEIFTVNDDGTQLTNLTNDLLGDITPAWSPDGTRIAFSSPRAGRYEIWVMNADGSNQIQITHSDEGYHTWSPAWSPDGGTIAFVRSDGLNRDIYSIAVDGTNEVNLTNSPVTEEAPNWQPLPPSSAARTAAAGSAYAPTVQCQRPSDGPPVSPALGLQSKRSVCRNRADHCLHVGFGGCNLSLPRIEGAPLVYREHGRYPVS
jgi:DNA-binding CsgD family transcriptional regulator